MEHVLCQFHCLDHLTEHDPLDWSYPRGAAGAQTAENAGLLVVALDAAAAAGEVHTLSPRPAKSVPRVWVYQPYTRVGFVRTQANK
jgi:hypothetical protein